MRRSITVQHVSIVETGAACVVNASNPTATLGGGVSRALFDECGGDVLQREMIDRLVAEFDSVLDIDDCLLTSGGTSTRIRYVLSVATVDYGGVRARDGGGGTVVNTVSSVERVQRATTAALRAAGALADDLGTRELSIAMPLLGAGSGGLAPVASVTAIVRGMQAYFREVPDAGIARIVIAVPEIDRVEACRARLETMLVTL